MLLKKQKTIEFRPKLEQWFNAVDIYTKSHQILEKENQCMQKEVKLLKTISHKLLEENKDVKSYTKVILEVIKHFFKELLNW